MERAEKIIEGQRIPNGKDGWKNHREDTTDRNQRGNAEK